MVKVKVIFDNSDGEHVIIPIKEVTFFTKKGVCDAIDVYWGNSKDDEEGKKCYIIEKLDRDTFIVYDDETTYIFVKLS